MNFLYTGGLTAQPPGARTERHSHPREYKMTIIILRNHRHHYKHLRAHSRKRQHFQDMGKNDELDSVLPRIVFCYTLFNIFVTGLLLRMRPDKLPLWYTAQMMCYMPPRFMDHYRRCHHFFFADLCYWVNLMVIPSVAELSKFSYYYLYGCFRRRFI